MPRPPAASAPAPRGFDRHWRRSLAFTVTLVALVAAAMGADWGVTVACVATAAVGFGFFYLLFPGGGHFGMTVANFVALYACLFEFFRSANFAQAPRGLTLVALALPVLGFLATCFLRRRLVRALIRTRRGSELSHLPRFGRWFGGSLVVGAASFLLPRLDLDPLTQGVTLVGSMALITGVVVLAARDVILVMVDIAQVFETVTARLDRLVMPMMAFLTFYALLVVVFGCLYRIADLVSPVPPFALHGQPSRISFVDAQYYSVASITTLGFGDIVPTAMLARALTGVEVVSGVLMLLFGFSEIMRSAGPDSRSRRPDPRDAAPPSPPRDPA
jgi:voltage-gated potassium channel